LWGWNLHTSSFGLLPLVHKQESDLAANMEGGNAVGLGLAGFPVVAD